MEDIKALAAEHHENAAGHFVVAVKLHQDAAKHVASGNFEKGEQLAISAAEAEAVANRHAMEALTLHRQHTQQLADRKAEADSEEIARAAKHEAKVSGRE